MEEILANNSYCREELQTQLQWHLTRESSYVAAICKFLTEV